MDPRNDYQPSGARSGQKFDNHEKHQKTMTSTIASTLFAVLWSLGTGKQRRNATMLAPPCQRECRPNGLTRTTEPVARTFWKSQSAGLDRTRLCHPWAHKPDGWGSGSDVSVSHVVGLGISWTQVSHL